jgi:hypothetical protein
MRSSLARSARERVSVIFITDIYFGECFHLGKVSLNDDYHSEIDHKSQWHCPTPTAGSGG